MGEVFDWVNLPGTTEEISLWESLHDGDLVALSSDLLQRTVQIEVDVPYILEFHGLDAAIRFVLLLHGVRSARVTTSRMWPGEFSLPPGIAYEESSKLIKEYQAKWREESFSWEDFEQKLAAATDVEIMDAAFAVSEGEAVAIRLGLMHRNDYWTAFIAAESLTMSMSDGKEISLNEFMALGEAYWKAFAERRR